MKRRTKIIPKNVLAQEQLRRKYLEEPWPQNLILVKSTIKDNGIRTRGQVTKLFYNLSYPYLYIDSRDLEGLGDMVIEAKKEIADAKTISGSERNIPASNSITDADEVKQPGKRKSGRPRKSSRSKKDGSSNTGKDGKVSAGDNE